MKSVFRFVLIIIVVFPFEKIQAQTSPTYKEIALAFFKNYKIDTGYYLKISHRKEGWHVGKLDYENPNDILEDQLFWSNNKRVFELLSWPKVNVTDSIAETETESHLKMIDWPALAYEFERMNYFGYPGWNWDVIDVLANKLNKTDTELEVLARAYSNYGSGFLYDQYGDFFENNDVDRKRLKDDEIVSNSRVEKFKFYQNKTLDTYSLLVEQNPLYQTKVGNVAIKLYNEFIYSYGSLNMAGDSVSAKTFLHSLNYPDSLIDQSKAFLDNVPQNGILFTAGDNDTYPLIYLQLVKGYRPDILVLNTSLLSFRRYVRMNNKMHSGLVSIPDTSFMKTNFDYFVYGGDDIDEPIEAASLIKFLKDDWVDPNASVTYSMGLPLKRYYSKKIFFNGNKEKNIFLGPYLFMNDLFIIDIINNHSSKRSINFTFNHELFSRLLELGDFGYKLNL